jgi:hypothetical protein
VAFPGNKIFIFIALLRLRPGHGIPRQQARRLHRRIQIYGEETDDTACKGSRMQAACYK